MKRSCQMLYAMHIFISSPLHAYIPEAVYETSYTAAETKQAPCMTGYGIVPFEYMCKKFTFQCAWLVATRPFDIEISMLI
jgi:hypothetical protein